jgi:biotin carboxyl carrier protein
MDNNQVADQPSEASKPRLWFRIIAVILLLIALAGVLAYKKTLQIQEQITQGSQLPPPISVTVATAESAQWNRRIRAVGTLVAFQGVDITTEESGIVTAINFESGDEVETGSLLIELDNRTEMANLESARAQFEADNSQYQRLLKLKDQSFVTNNDIDTQASLVDIAEARINVAKTALSKKRIYAPFSGRLGIRQVDLGQYIAPGGTIVTLLSLDKLYLDFTLPESNFKDARTRIGASLHGSKHGIHSSTPIRAIFRFAPLSTIANACWRPVCLPTCRCDPNASYRYCQCRKRRFFTIFTAKRFTYSKNRMPLKKIPIRISVWRRAR